MERNHKDQRRNKRKRNEGTIVTINKTKSWFFEKIKLTSLQPDSSRKREASNQQNQKWKRRGYNRQCRNAKDYKRLL